MSALLAGALACVAPGQSTHAQTAVDASGSPAGVIDAPFGNATLDPTERMLLEADELVYDFDNEIVSAVGNVQINYDGHTVTAQRVTYNQRTARLEAFGSVVLTEPGGNVILADYVNLNENLRDGFVDSLTVLAPDESRFGAASAERRGEQTVFNDGTFTACPACEDNPEKPLTWQIKAARVIYDQKEKMVYYENARFEFFGVPIAYLPYFFHPAPDNERQSGFLPPEVEFSSSRGLGIGMPYYWAIAPDKDLTVTPVLYSNQGLMLKGEYRQRFERGTVQLRGAGIHQADPGEFGPPGDRRNRGYIEGWGRFKINEFFDWGFNAFGMSDREFIGDYRLSTLTEGRSQLFLTGLSTRNHFNAEVTHYSILGSRDYQSEVPVVHPVVDYNYIVGREVFGGTLSFNGNLTSLSRDEPDFMRLTTACDETAPTTADCFLNGTPGMFTRFTTEANWRATHNVAGGHLLTPFLSVRGDLFHGDVDDPFGNVAAFTPVDDRSVARGMATAGLEWRYPILANHTGGYTVIEPVAQVIARPNEQNADEFVNEDAQSFVFDDTTLLAWDKFSGYDRTEGGSRANLAIKTKTRLNNGYVIDSVFGQSFHLGGDNPFPADSGLETDRSDYVAALYIAPRPELRLAFKGRFDEDNFELKRGDVRLGVTSGRFNGSVTYSSIDAQPSLGHPNDRSEISGQASYKLHEHWSVLGSARYDVADSRMLSHTAGISYQDLCYAGSIVYENVRFSTDDVEADERIMFRFSVRHVGETQFSAGLPN